MRVSTALSLFPSAEFLQQPGYWYQNQGLCIDDTPGSRSNQQALPAQKFPPERLTVTQQERKLTVGASLLYLYLNLRHYFCATAGIFENQPLKEKTLIEPWH